MGKRPTLTLKPKRPAADGDTDAWGKMLDQPGRPDPFHPHMLTKPSECPAGDADKLVAAVLNFMAMQQAGRQLSSSDVMAWQHACSALVLKIGNSAKTVEPPPVERPERKWSMGG